MKTKYKYFFMSTSILTMGVAISMPILLNEFAIKSYTPIHSWWKIDDNNVIHINDPKFSNNIYNINITDSNNNVISIDYQLSKIVNNNIYLVLNNLNTNIQTIKIVDISKNSSLALSSSHIKTFSKYDLLNDQEYFYNCIEDMCTNGIPTIGFIRNASLITQQAFYISLINYYNDNTSLSDSTYWFGWNELWSQNKINFDILIKNGLSDGNFEFNSNFVPNSFNIFKANDMYSVSSFNTDKIIEYFTIIMQKNNTDKFDFVTDEIHFIKMMKQNDSKFFNFIFKHANRIIIMSDGANHTNETVPYLASELINHKPLSREATINMFNDFLVGNKKSLSKSDILNLLLLKKYEQINNNSNFNFVQFINYDANIFNSINLNDNLQWNESAFSTNFINYSKILNNSNAQQQFLKLFTDLFLSQDLSIDNIFVNGQANYDSKKKNAIFIGSSLFKPISGEVTPNNFSRLDLMPDVLNEIQNTFASFLDKYPQSEYNIIFKLHPVFSNKNDPQNLSAINYVRQISNNLIQDPIIVNPSIPIETWIASDYYNFYTNNKSFPSILFKSENPETWTTFFGFQATTTTIHTIRLFYQSTFGIDKYRVSELIPFSNFPIPKLFHVVKRLESNNNSYNYYYDNLNQIKKIYEPYCTSIYFGSEFLEDYDSIVLNFGDN